MVEQYDNERKKIEEEILTMVGGDFSPDSLGPDRHAAMIAKVQSRPDAYLDALEAMFFGDRFNPELMSQYYVPGFLMLLVDVAPERVRDLGRQLMEGLDSISARTAAGASRKATTTPEADPDLELRLDQRLLQLKALFRSLPDSEYG